ncbi:MAG: hypothetical protein KGI98_09085 [Euryarchaeota archaeon]|nr:hypothetical protein [Euryarchaeota archaeon]
MNDTAFQSAGYNEPKTYDYRKTGGTHPTEHLVVRKGVQSERGCSKCRLSDMMAVTCGTCAFADGTLRCQHYCLCDDGPLETRACCT